MIIFVACLFVSLGKVIIHIGPILNYKLAKFYVLAFSADLLCTVQIKT